MQRCLKISHKLWTILQFCLQFHVENCEGDKTCCIECDTMARMVVGMLDKELNPAQQKVRVI